MHHLKDTHPLIADYDADDYDYCTHWQQLLAEDGWDSRVVASVNNFRRWDQGLPAWVVSLFRPVIYGLEMVGQRVGMGWWGPSQFIWATWGELRTAQEPMAIQPTALCSTPWAALAMKMICPICRLPLRWSDDVAHCESCSCVFPRTGLIWDFVPQERTPAVRPILHRQ